MKKLLLNLAVILFFSNIVFSSNNPSKHALIIAVADYPEIGGWKDISSNNDVSLIMSALLRQGFSGANIKVILNSEANKQGIINEFNALTSRVKVGDVVVIHFSGHGQRISDNENNDEIDGYDEALIPYDAQLNYSSVYKGENHLRDDEIAILLDGLGKKLGDNGNILVILDSCHSGTATRGLAKSRGTNIKFQEPGYDPVQKSDTDNFSEIIKSDEMGLLASLVVISGAGQEELNYEFLDKTSNIRYGSLSYSFSKVLANVTPQTTYRALFDKIKVEMSIIAPNQSPQLEGNVDQQIFGGEAVDQKPYFTIDKWIDDTTVTINAGNLMGIYDGTVVGFYDINTSNPNGIKPKANGTIAYSSAVQADVVLDDPISQMESKNSWLFVTKQNFGDLSVRVKIENLQNKQLEKLLVDKCKQLPSITIVKENPELLIELLNKTQDDSLQIITANEMQVFSIDLKSGNTEQLVEMIMIRLKNYVQANLLKAIEFKDSDLNVSFEIIPVTVKRIGSRYVVDNRLPINSKLRNGNHLEFTDGDTFKLKVKNNGYSKAYYQIIDIQPDNNINILIPATGRKSAEYVIYPGEEQESDNIFVFGEPYGTELFKLISTREPIDLTMISITRGEGTRGFDSPFEQLFAESYRQTRAKPISVPPGSVNTFTVAFKIVKKGD